jgi:hypothetical protein
MAPPPDQFPVGVSALLAGGVALFFLLLAGLALLARVLFIPLLLFLLPLLFLLIGLLPLLLVLLTLGVVVTRLDFLRRELAGLLLGAHDIYLVALLRGSRRQAAHASCRGSATVGACLLDNCQTDVNPAPGFH